MVKLIGREITRVERGIPPQHDHWSIETDILHLDDGTQLFAAQDPEANASGELWEAITDKLACHIADELVGLEISDIIAIQPASEVLNHWRGRSPAIEVHFKSSDLVLIAAQDGELNGAGSLQLVSPDGDIIVITKS